VQTVCSYKLSICWRQLSWHAVRTLLLPHDCCLAMAIHGRHQLHHFGTLFECLTTFGFSPPSTWCSHFSKQALHQNQNAKLLMKAAVECTISACTAGFGMSKTSSPVRLQHAPSLRSWKESAKMQLAGRNCACIMGCAKAADALLTSNAPHMVATGIDACPASCSWHA
jgi:hypothetical protein